MPSLRGKLMDYSAGLVRTHQRVVAMEVDREAMEVDRVAMEESRLLGPQNTLHK